MAKGGPITLFIKLDLFNADIILNDQGRPNYFNIKLYVCLNIYNLNGQGWPNYLIIKLYLF